MAQATLGGSLSDLFISYTLDIVQHNIERFTGEFLAYLTDNLHVYRAFEREALKIVQHGHKHYSARTIIEVLRHQSALKETVGPWKLNDHHTPALARVFAMVHPQHAGLFEFRKTRQEREACEA